MTDIASDKAGPEGLLDLPQLVLAQILQAATELCSGRERQQQICLSLARDYRDLILKASSRASLRLRLVPKPGDVAAASRLLGRLCAQCQPGLDLSISMSRETSDLDQLLTSAPITGWEKVHTLQLQVSGLQHLQSRQRIPSAMCYQNPGMMCSAPGC
jgi:hypothetical protein